MISLEQAIERLDNEPRIRKFVDVWRRWRGDRPMPDRSDIVPEMLGAALAHTGLLEVGEPGHLIFRVLPSEHYHMGVVGAKRGINIIDMAPPEQRHARWKRHRDLLDWPCAAVFERTLRSPEGLTNLMKVLMLPVSNDASPEIGLVLIAIDTEKNASLLTTAATETVPLADNFEYVDIGFGVPDTVPA